MVICYFRVKSSSMINIYVLSHPLTLRNFLVIQISVFLNGTFVKLSKVNI